MSKSISTCSQSQQENLQTKLLALYDLNKSYVDAAEKFLSASPQTLSAECCEKSLSREDIDRLYSHIFVLEHIAKLLYEEFLINKSGGLPERPGHDADRRIK